MSHITIRPFQPTDAEYATITAIQNAVWPDNLQHADNFKYRDQKQDKNQFYQRLVVEKDGRIVAFGLMCETWWSPKPGKYYFNLLVHPQHQRQGIGYFMYQYIYERLVQQPQFNMLTADTTEEKPEAITFLHRRGFEQVMRYPVSELDVSQFNANGANAMHQKINGSPIQLKTVAELQAEDTEWLRKLWRLECEIEQDIPSPEPTVIEPFEQYAKIVAHPGFFPEAFVVAVENGRFVGTSTLWKSISEPDKLYTGLTGVLRSHRRRGLATAMKIKNFNLAKGIGIKTIETDNEENNPMYQINLRLGFKPKPASLDFHKQIV